MVLEFHNQNLRQIGSQVKIGHKKQQTEITTLYV